MQKKEGSNSRISKNSDLVCITIDEEIYHERVSLYKASFIGRLNLLKGDQPWQSKESTQKLHEIWKPSSHWHFMSLGKEYLNMHFSKQEDQDKVWSMRAITIQPSIFCLHPWSPKFNPPNRKPKNA